MDTNMKDDIKITVNSKPAVLEWNHEEVMESVKQMMSAYENLPVEDMEISVLKKDRATLRNIKKEIDDRRKKVKKEYNDPYMEFAGKVAEITDLIDKPITKLDNHIKEVERLAREEKKSDIESYFNSNVGEMAEYINFERKFRGDWLTTKYSMKAIRADVDSIIDNAKAEVELIGTMDEEFVEHAKKMYSEGRRLVECIEYINQMKEQRERIMAAEEKRKQREEELRIEKERLKKEREEEEEKERLRKAEQDMQELAAEEEQERIESAVMEMEVKQKQVFYKPKVSTEEIGFGDVYDGFVKDNDVKVCPAELSGFYIPSGFEPEEIVNPNRVTKSRYELVFYAGNSAAQTIDNFARENAEVVHCRKVED